MTERRSPRRRELSPKEYVEGVLGGDRAVLGRAITLVESRSPRHQALAQEVLSRVLPAAGGATRVGLTGVPGVGKSSLIEVWGAQLLEAGHRVAVLAVDPSSPLSKGSILGDKTRMTHLSRDPRAFVRPSPTGGTLGGVARATREAMLLLEAAGFDVVLVETVGVGQSEVAVKEMVDFFLLLMLAGAGDELQGIKRGVVELADAMVITKADGDNRPLARQAAQAYRRALELLTPATEGWQVPVLTCSAVTGEGVTELWETIERHRALAEASGQLQARRRQQDLEWMHRLVRERLERRFFSDPAVKAELAAIEEAVISGDILPTVAAERLLKAGEAE